MWNNIKHWLIHIFTPHCPQCYELELERRICPACDTLKLQIAMLNQQNGQLLDRLLQKDNSVDDVPAEEDLKPLNQFVPWKVKQQLLEQEDRARARALRNNLATVASPEEQKEIEELEKKVGLNVGQTS